LASELRVSLRDPFPALIWRLPPIPLAHVDTVLAPGAYPALARWRPSNAGLSLLRDRHVPVLPGCAGRAVARPGATRCYPLTDRPAARQGLVKRERLLVGELVVDGLDLGRHH